MEAKKKTILRREWSTILAGKSNLYPKLIFKSPKTRFWTFCPCVLEFVIKRTMKVSLEPQCSRGL